MRTNSGRIKEQIILLNIAAMSGKVHKFQVVSWHILAQNQDVADVWGSAAADLERALTKAGT